MMSGADVELRLRMETDAQMMAELGGPRPRAAIRRAHASSLLLAASGECWPLKIVPEGSTQAAGTVAVWRGSDDPAGEYEIGWMVLTEYQGRGLATEAVREVCERARRERKFGVLHAYPAVNNAPSNRVCERAGFSLLGQVEVEFGGHRLHCNHWRIELFPPELPG
jgi:RimJ/RimL family protein N-acetyltransferase